MMPIFGPIRDWVRSLDFFGHQVRLNFDKKGDTHNTIVGGFFSIFIRAFITWYIVMNFYKLIAFESDNMQYTESLVDHISGNDGVQFKDTNFTVFGVLKNLNYGRQILDKNDEQHMQPIFFSEGVERYIQLLFVQNTDNLYETDPDKMYLR